MRRSHLALLLTDYKRRIRVTFQYSSGKIQYSSPLTPTRRTQFCTHQGTRFEVPPEPALWRDNLSDERDQQSEVAHLCLSKQTTTKYWKRLP